MASAGENGHSGRARCRRLAPRAVWLVLGLALLVTLPGCAGCRKDPAKAEKDLEKRLIEQRAKKKKEPKPDFEGIKGGKPRLATRPSGGLADQRSDPLGPPYKPGHWTGTTLAAKTNNFDFVGDLEIAAGSLSRGKWKPIPLAKTEFDLTTSRQASLPKRQPKVFESILFVPPSPKQALVSCRLNHGKGGRPAWESTGRRLSPMPSYQYHFVVLARWPQRYTYLKGLASIKPPSDEFSGNSTKPHYLVALMRDEKRILLPSRELLWTSIACMLWDSADPGRLSLDQQQSLLDWLHWGGQLILSGPETLDGLSGSFLAPYLPATAAPGARKLDEADFKPLCAWANRNKEGSIRPLAPARPLEGVRLEKHPQARFLPESGELLAERRVGRGRIVVSAFRLSARELTSWPGLDELLNAFLLRRPARKFTDHVERGLQVTWADAPDRRLDAARISSVRYFTRDTGLEFANYGADARRRDEDLGGDLDGGLPAAPGVAAWNDSGPVANAAREALLDAAQIKIPQRSFVLWIVAGYLLVLVPVNWGVFRLFGRVEWAWVAAPVIAVACTAVVIRAARLDIGFARSRTEITVLELQAGYPRAHLTRYAALYTSLTTQYNVHLEDPGAQVLPFPKSARSEELPDRRRLLYRCGKGASLLDYYVRSNSTGLVHSEQMIDLGAALSLDKTADDRWKVVNGTNLTLHDAGVVRKDDSESLETAWIGRLEPGAMARLRFRRQTRPSAGTLLWEEQCQDPTLTGGNLAPGELNLCQLVLLAQGQAKDDRGRDVEPLRPGEMRLVAALDEQISGMAIKPAAPQAQIAGLVIAHLQYGPGKDPQPDTNTPKNPERQRRPNPYEGFQISN